MPMEPLEVERRRRALELATRRYAATVAALTAEEARLDRSLRTAELHATRDPSQFGRLAAVQVECAVWEEVAPTKLAAAQRDVAIAEEQLALALE